MKKLVFAAAIAATFATSAAQAEEAVSEHNLNYHVAATSDYRFRGLSKSDEHPALQGAITYTHRSGVYVRGWMSTLKNNPAGADVEIDLFAGYRGALGGGFTYNVGIVNITFPSGGKLNTTEAYVGVDYGPISVTYLRSLTDFCGYDDSVGSSYLTTTATFDLGDGFDLGLHAGYQNIRNYGGDDDYADYSVSISKTFSGVNLSLAAVDNDKSNEDIGLVFTASKSF